MSNTNDLFSNYVSYSFNHLHIMFYIFAPVLREPIIHSLCRVQASVMT